MEKKFNLVKILENCPTGMELDSPIWDGVVFDHIDIMKDTYPIYIKKMGGIKECLTENGYFDSDPGAKCVIFPKGKDTWEGFQRPFKDGDIVYNRLQKRICIYHYIEDETPCISHCRYNEYNKTFEILDDICIVKQDYRLATEEEKEKLFDAIKSNGYKWNFEKKTLEKLIIIPKFKIGDKILKNGYTTVTTIKEIRENDYIITFPDLFGNAYITDKLSFSNQNDWELFKPKFKVGDRIAEIGGSKKGEIIYIDLDKYHVAVSNNIGIDILFENQDYWELVNDNFESKSISPKFKEGDRIVLKDNPYNMPSLKIKTVTNELYILEEGFLYITSTDERYVLENKFNINDLKPFDKVLVRYNSDSVWIAQLFEAYDKTQYWPIFCVGHTRYKQCIPYKDNESLLGTTKECDDFYKIWED